MAHLAVSFDSSFGCSRFCLHIHRTSKLCQTKFPETKFSPRTWYSFPNRCLESVNLIEVSGEKINSLVLETGNSLPFSYTTKDNQVRKPLWEEKRKKRKKKAMLRLFVYQKPWRKVVSKVSLKRDPCRRRVYHLCLGFRKHSTRWK